MGEGVDISYTKGGDIDNNAYNSVAPQLDQRYVGWTEPGEWIRYSVEVKKATHLARVTLLARKHVLTQHTVTNGNMNYDYLEFSRVE